MISSISTAMASSILAFSFAEVMNQAKMLLVLQNSAMCVGIWSRQMSPLFAKIITGTCSPFGSKTLLRKSFNHYKKQNNKQQKFLILYKQTFSIELKVSGRVKSKTIAAATLKFDLFICVRVSHLFTNSRISIVNTG